MKCKKIFALLLSLCMIASLFVAMPVSAATENVIDIDLSLDDASELTWKQSGVTVSNADGIGGRDNVVLASGLSNSNNNTVGVKLPDGFSFADGDVLTYSVDVYSETAINPDMWLRNHASALNPFATLYESEITANTWTTIEKTYTFAELEAKIATSNSSGSFTTAGNYAFYMRPRQNATVYFDNFKLTVSRPVVERHNVIDITVNDASDITWKNGGTAADANGIGGRDGVIALGNLASSNSNTAGVVLADSFAFQEGDILTYSLDVYSSTVTNPDIWLRNHGSSLSPYKTFYSSSIAANTWTTITKTVAYAELIAAGSFDMADKYALYVRPRDGQSGIVYVDNFTVTVSREGAEEHIHAYGEWVAEGDDNHSKSCDCGDVVTEAHAWDEGVVTLEPTYTAKGEKLFTCSVCDYEKTEEMAKLQKRENVIDITVSDANDITWKNGGTAANADGIGGRDGVVALGNLANSNGNTAGVKLPDGFSFAEGDILTYSVDVYSESAINPDIWLRNHGSVLNPMAVFYNDTLAANTWTTLTRTVTFEELEAIIPTVNSSGTFATSGNYALYLRLRDSQTGTVYVDNFTVTVARIGYEEPPHEHVYEGVVTTPATCEDDGVMTYTCECGDSYTEAIKATGHEYDEGVVTKEPTHTETGVKTFTCICGDSYTESIPANVDAHEYDEGVVTKEPTATEDGVKTYTCKCGATYTEVIPATGTGDTTTGGGTTGGCVHTYDNGVITVEPTTKSEGEITYTCTVCGESYTEIIPILAPGDIDGDEEIGTKDVISFRRWLTGGYGVRMFKAAADVFKDGKLDAKDVITIRRFIVGGYGVVLQ